MLFEMPRLDGDERHVVDEIRGLRERLRYQTLEPRKWTGLLRKMAFARNIQGSNSIEGYSVDLSDAVAAADKEEPITPDVQSETWLAVTGYRDAMTYILQLADEPDTPCDVSLINSLHYMMLHYDLDQRPGRFRRGAVYVHDGLRNEIVYEGAESTEVPSLMDELVAQINDGDPETPVTVRAAMAHLNLVMIHPYKDGNGRMARALQTLVLAREGIVAPEFSSIEEYLGTNTQAYYDVLAQVGGGSWQPHRDPRPWIRFTLTAHYQQARTLLRRLRETERLFDALEREASRLGFSERIVSALWVAAVGGRIRRAMYMALADVSDAAATRDLRRLTEAGLLEPHGEKRGRFYTAAEPVRRLRQETKEPRDRELDPFRQLAS